MQLRSTRGGVALQPASTLLGAPELDAVPDGADWSQHVVKPFLRGKRSACRSNGPATRRPGTVQYSCAQAGAALLRNARAIKHGNSVVSRYR